MIRFTEQYDELVESGGWRAKAAKSLRPLWAHLCEQGQCTRYHISQTRRLSMVGDPVGSNDEGATLSAFGFALGHLVAEHVQDDLLRHYDHDDRPSVKTVISGEEVDFNMPALGWGLYRKVYGALGIDVNMGDLAAECANFWHEMEELHDSWTTANGQDNIERFIGIALEELGLGITEKWLRNEPEVDDQGRFLARQNEAAEGITLLLGTLNECITEPGATCFASDLSDRAKLEQMTKRLAYISEISEAAIYNKI